MFLIAKIVRGRRLLHELEQQEKEKERERQQQQHHHYAQKDNQQQQQPSHQQQWHDASSPGANIDKSASTAAAGGSTQAAANCAAARRRRFSSLQSKTLSGTPSAREVPAGWQDDDMPSTSTAYNTLDVGSSSENTRGNALLRRRKTWSVLDSRQREAFPAPGRRLRVSFSLGGSAPSAAAAEASGRTPLVRTRTRTGPPRRLTERQQRRRFSKLLLRQQQQQQQGRPVRRERLYNVARLSTPLDDSIDSARKKLRRNRSALIPAGDLELRKTVRQKTDSCLPSDSDGQADDLLLQPPYRGGDADGAQMRRTSSMPSVVLDEAEKLAPCSMRHYNYDLKLSKLQKRALRFTWHRLHTRNGGRRVENVFEEVFDRLTKIVPIMREMFTTRIFLSAMSKGENSSSTTLREHARLIVRVVDAAIKNLDVDERRRTDTGSDVDPLRVGRAHGSLRPYGFVASLWEKLGETIIDVVLAQEAVRDLPGAGQAWVVLTACLVDQLRAGFENSRDSSQQQQLRVCGGGCPLPSSPHQYRFQQQRQLQQQQQQQEELQNQQQRLQEAEDNGRKIRRTEGGASPNVSALRRISLSEQSAGPGGVAGSAGASANPAGVDSPQLTPLQMQQRYDYRCDGANEGLDYGTFSLPYGVGGPVSNFLPQNYVLAQQQQQQQQQHWASMEAFGASPAYAACEYSPAPSPSSTSVSSGCSTAVQRVNAAAATAGGSPRRRFTAALQHEELEQLRACADGVATAAAERRLSSPSRHALDSAADAVNQMASRLSIAGVAANSPPADPAAHSPSAASFESTGGGSQSRRGSCAKVMTINQNGNRADHEGHVLAMPKRLSPSPAECVAALNARRHSQHVDGSGDGDTGTALADLPFDYHHRGSAFAADSGLSPAYAMR